MTRLPAPASRRSPAPAVTRLGGLLLLAAALAGCPDDPIVPADAVPADTSAADAEAPDAADATAAPEDTGAPPPDTAEPGLALSAVLPDRGFASGLEQVELTGSGFAAGMQVYFGESLAQDIFVLNSRRIIALTPPRSPGLVDVKVVEPETGTQAVLDSGYLFFNPVAVVEVDPPSGHLLGGEPVTLRGRGFRAGTVVLFGTTAAVSVEVLDDATLQAITPAGVAVGPVPVHVSNDRGLSTLDAGYTYIDAPRVDAVIPRAGLVAGGEPVELVGQGFHAPVTVLFGGRPLTDLEVLSPTRVRGAAPAAPSPGPVAVTASSAWGTTTLANGYLYLAAFDPTAAPAVLGVSPAAGPASGRNRATVLAAGLTTLADTAIRFGAAPALVIDVDAAGHTATVEVPPGAVGPTSVTLDNARGTSTLAAAYTYEPFVRVYEVLPNFGPVTGGTAITLSGEGFAPGASVRVGALPASSVNIIDTNTLTAVTPPGSPGLVQVTVSLAGRSDTLVGGYLYQAPLSLWVVDTPPGSQAGGTLTTLVGAGFPADARVTFGGHPATHVSVVSPTVITCKTPPGALGTVDVAVTSPTRGPALLAQAFTYYNPESTYGGTWGQEVLGDVNLTVLDSSSGAPIPDAFVMLWTDPETPYQGFTNLDGQITFSGPDLGGEQMASASKTGYSSASVIEYDATNLTLYLNPTTPPTPGTPPQVEQPFFRGRVTNLGKAVPIPWGQCAQKVDAPAPLCQACATDDQCGPGYRCSDLPDQGKFCTLHCAVNANCPEGFMCFPLNGVVEHQCVPTAGEVTAFCDFSNPHIFAEDELPDPGVEVNPDLTFELPVPLGEFAVYCWGGLIDRAWGEFTPYALGVVRHVFANPGDQLEGEVRLAHALNRTYTVALDPVPRGPEGPDINVLFRYLDLGGDGVITFLNQVDSWGDEPFQLTNFIGPLSGDLYDASLTFMAGSFALTSNFIPYTLTLHQGLTSLENDEMYYLTAGTWLPRSTGVTNNIHALWRVGPGDTVGVGTQGLIIRSLGTSWARQPSGVDVTLRGVHAHGSGLAVAVGDGGALTQWDGFRWAKTASGTSLDLRAVWVGAPDFAVAVGFYTVVAFNGATWAPMLGNTSRNLYGVWGFGRSDVWAVGAFGQILRYDGAAWQSVPSGTSKGLRAVWGAAPDDVWMVGEGGTLLHWDGVALAPHPVDTTQTFNALWGSSGSDVYAVGARGTAFHWDGSAWTRVHLGGASKSTALLAIGGDPGAPVVTGAHELVLGPMLAVPEQLSPGEGGVMGDDYRIRWQTQPGVDPHFSMVEVAVPSLFGPVPEWSMVADWDVQDVLLPDFPNIEGTPGISAGMKILTIFRVYKEGFDIDHYSNQDFNQLAWRSWSVHQVLFTKQ